MKHYSGIGDTGTKPTSHLAKPNEKGLHCTHESITSHLIRGVKRRGQHISTKAMEYVLSNALFAGIIGCSNGEE